ncbi:hypothetical protein PsorP6_013770 [Peronosclerospora sorghi]|uniref:Uncharacterized protein n=1 Tax=Peronosclerospora sorghi TaxID=230839 RepID=A0ACC0VFC6_9STRA|nr:hypothetical protein PsorP6_013770 [Peronosclerospora sorghi]
MSKNSTQFSVAEKRDRWSSGRDYRGGRGGRGRRGYGRGSHTLDNSTTIVKVENLPEEARVSVVLTRHFGNFGAVERVDYG